ncbi:hypothetical protein CWS02_15305 [Enterobacter sp. EA-1]|nr:hypothetical protein CWS02_15305 [Enterobacter sp. EA-1]
MIYRQKENKNSVSKIICAVSQRSVIKVLSSHKKVSADSLKNHAFVAKQAKARAGMAHFTTVSLAISSREYRQ